VRHPLYLAEAVATLGVFLLYRSYEAALLVLVQFAVQVWRMREEEKVLRASFPEYAVYSKRTRRPAFDAAFWRGDSGCLLAEEGGLQ
jgi:protein-S-isoprenylcysteine O-methyltransferase Ste14